MAICFSSNWEFLESVETVWRSQFTVGVQLLFLLSRWIWQLLTIVNKNPEIFTQFSANVELIPLQSFFFILWRRPRTKNEPFKQYPRCWPLAINFISKSLTLWPTSKTIKITHCFHLHTGNKTAGTYKEYLKASAIDTCAIQCCIQKAECNVAFVFNEKCFHVKCNSDEQCMPLERTNMETKLKMVLVNPVALGECCIVKVQTLTSK